MTKDMIFNKFHSARFWVVNVLLSLFVAFMFAAGSVLDKTDSWQITDKSMWLHFCIAFIVALVASIVLSFIKLSPSKNSKIIKRVYAIPFIAWFLSLLACFPGVFSYDCYEEWKMIVENKITNHHPYLHVVLLGGLTELSNSLFGTGNAGILVYVIIQMAFGLFVISKVLGFLRDKYKSAIIEWITIVFYSLSPVVLMYIIATTKDSIFSLFELWFIVVCLELVDKDAKSKYLSADFVISSLGTMIFRKNGLYIVVISLFVLAFIKRKEIKRLIRPLIIIIAIYFVYSVPLSYALNIGSSSSAEMFSVPIQQMARVYHFDRESLSEDELETMYKYIDKDYWDKYIPTTADAVKMGFIQTNYEAGKIDFLKLWLGLGAKHPMTYINAFLANTVDFWYPLSVNDGYRWLYGLDENKSNYFDYRVAEPGKEVVLIKPLNHILKYFSENREATTKVLPSLILNPGWYILIWLFSLADSIKNKKRNNVIFHVIMGMSLLTVLMGPMALVRYVIVFYLVLPIEVAFVFAKEKNNG